jgi:hypothetical protein
MKALDSTRYRVQLVEVEEKMMPTAGSVGRGFLLSVGRLSGYFWKTCIATHMGEAGPSV